MDTRLARGILRAHRVLVSLGSFFFFQAEDGIRDWSVTGVQTCALPILGVVPGQKAADAAHAMLAAPPGAASPEPIVDRSQRVVLDTPDGRIVLVDSMLFASPANHNDVMCCGSHGGRVNMARALEIRPRGALFSDGGGAREGSGVNGLPLLDAAEVAAATVDAMRARIGDPASTWADGVISAVNDTARRARVVVGQPAGAAARAMLAYKRSW